MLLVSCISLTGSLMLIHYSVLCAVGAGKLKLPPLKKKSKKHHDSFLPNNRYCATPPEAFPWKSLCCVLTCFLCLSQNSAFPKNYLPRNSYKHSFFCVRGGEESSGCQCLAVRIPLILTRSHLLRKWCSVSLHIMSGHNWQYYGN